MTGPENLTPEGERCNACGHLYLDVWRTSDDLWAKVTGRTDGGGTWCPRCFEFVAREKGYIPYWEARHDEFPTEADRRRLEALEGTGLEAAAELAGRLYRNIKSNENDGIGHLALRFTEKDGRVGAVVVLAPDDGNVEILDTIDAIYDRQDEAALAAGNGETRNGPD